MRRLIAVMAAALIASGAFADDKDRGDNGQRSARADCAHQANERKLKGKERRHFMKDCNKQSKRRGEDREQAARAAPNPSSPAAQPTPAAPPPAATVPAAQPSPTPAPQPTATGPQPSITAAAKRTAPNSPERRTECQNSEEYRKAPVLRKPSLLNKCVAAP